MDSEGLDLFPRESDLVNLKKYLNYHLSSFLLFALSFFSLILILLLTAAALIFTPYVIFVLYRNDKNGWILSLILLIILPAIIFILVVKPVAAMVLLLLIELALFYVYCFSLRLAVDGWVKEITTARLIDYQRKKHRDQQNDELF
ncbi:MAG TPA: hypothetical protein VKD08_16725 [Ignavibacteriaceae bacterium]|jgi:hypothetical protein|nr:hypothetical protein [Ignavibacteriaceae bacterium]